MFKLEEFRSKSLKQVLINDDKSGLGVLQDPLNISECFKSHTTAVCFSLCRSFCTVASACPDECLRGGSKPEGLSYQAPNEWLILFNIG